MWNCRRWMLQNTFHDKSTLFWVMAWCLAPPSQYLNQCWPIYVINHMASPQWVKGTSIGIDFDNYNCISKSSAHGFSKWWWSQSWLNQDHYHLQKLMAPDSHDSNRPNHQFHQNKLKCGYDWHVKIRAWLTLTQKLVCHILCRLYTCMDIIGVSGWDYAIPH